MFRRRSTIELLGREFADAVAGGDFERAEGWLAVARLVEARQPQRGIARRARRWTLVAPERLA